MGAYADHVEPRLVSLACSAGAVERYRRMVVPRAAGTVLEIGFGSGLNLPHYDPGKVERLLALEPYAPIRSLAARRLAETPLSTELLDAGAEAIPLPEDSVDTVLLTFTLCTVPDTAAALSEARRVLRPDGQLLFVEHGLAPDPGVARWQGRIEPVWSRLAGGCHLTRSAPALLRAAGFALPELDEGYAPKVPRFAGYVSTGRATA